MAVEPVGTWRVRGPMPFRVHVRSAAGSPVRLPPAATTFGWMTVIQTVGDQRDTHYSGKVPMPAESWPEQVAGETPLRFGPFDLGPGTSYGRKAARPLLTAYLSGKDDDLPKAAGPMNRTLKAGKAVVRFTLCLTREGGKPAIVKSEPTPADIGPPDMASLAEGDRKKFLDDLMDQFNTSPWSGLQAHNTCVGLGAEVLPRVIAAARDTSRPGHARLWLTTTLADIRDPRAAQALVALLDDPAGGVRNVVAYHGPKQRSKALDDAIVRKASADDAQLAAWALLGFMVHRDTVPESVLAAGLDSRDPKARGTAAEVLARHASDENLGHLVRLLSDENEQVRGVAAKMLGGSNRPDPKVLGALVKALDRPGESARQRICQALSKLTSENRPYNPTADATTRNATLAAWKAWWAASRP